MIRLVPAPAQTGSPQSDARPPPALDVSIEDWDVLFRAVQTRLSLLANTPPGDTFRDAMLDCIQALDQLRAAMVAEFSQAQPGGSACSG